VLLVMVPVGHALSMSTAIALRLPIVLCDLVLAWLVQAVLGWTGRSELERVLGTALVALGPIFLAVVALQGQLDAVSGLAVLGAVAVWMRADPARRWFYAGLILGVGAAIKTTPIFGLLALLPTAVSGRERLKVAALAIAIPALAVLPFAAVDHQTVHDIVGYHGAPGAGGLNLLVQPRVALDWYGAGGVSLSSASTHLGHLAGPLALLGAALAAAYSWRRHLDPLTSSVLIYAAILVLGVNFFLQYSLWLLPLVIAWGRLRTALAATIGLCVPLVFRYAEELHLRSTIWSTSAILHVYDPVTDALLLATAAATVVALVRIERGAARTAEPDWA
jgi:hypothetical protein